MPKVNMTERKDALATVDGRDISPFDFGYEWVCQAPGCDARSDPETGEPFPARLFIRSRTDRAEGPSNFDRTRQDVTRPETKQQPGELNWEGLAEERGWTTRFAVMCPACKAGMTVAEFKKAKRALGFA